MRSSGNPSAELFDFTPPHAPDAWQRRTRRRGGGRAFLISLDVMLAVSAGGLASWLVFLLLR